jgi:hypothetical protein
MKYHGGIRRRFSGGMTKRPKPVTCTNLGRQGCARGDLNPHALSDTGT